MRLVFRFLVPGLAALLAACGQRDRGPIESVPEAGAAPAPLVVVGIDAATWDVIDPMVERGELPVFASLIERGARADLIALPPVVSPVVWTTFATGRFARDHNILDHTYPYVPGPKRRVRSTLRRVPAIWNLATAAGQTVDVIGWFATHPAEVVNGAMVSNLTAEGAEGGLYPPRLETDLAPELARLEDREVMHQLWSEYFPWPFDPRAADRPGDPYQRVTEVAKGRLMRMIRQDDFIQRVALEMAPGGADLSLVYIRMPDHACHATWIYYDATGFDEQPDPAEAELLGDILPTSYRSADKFLGRLLEAYGEEVNLVLLSDHGCGSATGDWRVNRPGFEDLTGNHRPNAIWLASGPAFRAARLEGLTSLDVGPTLLAALGLPISRELPGRVFTEAFAPEFLARHPLRDSPGYRVTWSSVADAGTTAEGREQEGLDELAALGYLDPGTAVSAREGPAAESIWSVEPGLRLQSFLGESLFHLIRGDRAAAESMLREVAANDPDLAARLPGLTARYLRMWQPSFRFPLVDRAALEAFEEHHLVERLREQELAEAR